MAGVVLFMCIPTTKYEEILKLKSKKNIKIQTPDIEIPLHFKNYFKKLDYSNEHTPLLEGQCSSSCDTLNHEKPSMETVK